MSRHAHGNALPEGYRLHWYRIGRVLGQGGFGITYLATDTNLDKPVAIKEYLPIEFAVREGNSEVHPFTEDRKQTFLWGLERFLSEARTLARFVHPNIVRVIAVFEANNTAYMVMEYEQGSSLEALIKFGRLVDEASLLRIVHPLLDGLEHVHSAGFIHRDVKPSNVYVRSDGSPVLLDFGSARIALGSQSRTLTRVVSSGFSPYEQYGVEDGRQGPWTDIYGLGATLYAALDRGKPPLDAIVRGEARMENKPDPLQSAAELGRGRYSARFLQAIDAAMPFKPEDRPQSVAAWRAMFPAPEEAPEGQEPVTEIHPATAARERAAQPAPTRGWRIAVAVAILAVLAGGWWYTAHQREQEATRQAEARRQADRLAAQQREREAVQAQAARAAAEEAARRAAEAEARAARQREASEAQAGRAAAGEAARSEAEAADARRQAGIAALLADGERALAALRLTRPAGDNALEHFRAVLALDADNGDARRGLVRIVERYAELARAEAGKGNVQQAQRYLDAAAGVGAGEDVLATAREAVASLAAAGAGAPGAELRNRLADGTPGPEMVRVPAGRFRMGSPPDEPGREDAEGPQREVTIASDFALGRFEVTVAEFRRFVDATGHRTQAEAIDGCYTGQGKQEGNTWRDPGFRMPPQDDHPVVCVGWRDASRYAQWLSERTGQRYRLPSEAEWEYAARAGTAGARYFGDDPQQACRHANVGDRARAGAGGSIAGTPYPCHDGFAGPAPVGRFGANPLGLHDMLGNVWEWTADCWSESYAGAPGDGSAVSNASCTHHVRRGGNLASGVEQIRAASRRRGRPPGRLIGFRVARDL